MGHLKKRIKEELGLGMNDYHDIRIFNTEGLELYDEDFEFMNNDETVYVSTGEDFDHSSYYSEYDITKTQGMGGFGTVVLGIHKETGEKVAIKITKANAIDNADDIDMIFAEAETLKVLSHDKIVKLHNCFLVKKTLQAYFIMEYLEGGELLDYVQKHKTLPEEEAKNYFLQIVDAMEYCHGQKIIHRDLKLENQLKVSNNCQKIKVSTFFCKKNLGRRFWNCGLVRRSPKRSHKSWELELHGP